MMVNIVIFNITIFTIISTITDKSYDNFLIFFYSIVNLCEIHCSLDNMNRTLSKSFTTWR